MDFGINFGPRGAAGTPDGLAAFAAAAERLGYGYLGIADHIVFPRSSDARYPYAVDGKHPSNVTGYALEQLSCLAYIAGITRKVRLLTSVMVVPHRHPILAAKQLATIDVLSRGRMTVGIGVGWLEEEMAALGGPPYKQRGAASDAYVRAFRELWSSPDPKGDGTYACLDGLIFEPKPVQRPGPPIWVGGESPAARRRAGRLGDGWYPAVRNPAEPLDTPARFAAALAKVRHEAETAGRDPAALDVALFANGLSLGESRRASDGSRSSFTGSAADIAEDAAAYRAAGVKHLIIGFESNDLADALNKVEAFATDVMARVK
ncbi:MAG: TIGR03619 family F420-dependent LLM class oxidoreductase [Hyphomicrobiaceae bacterium]